MNTPVITPEGPMSDAELARYHSLVIPHRWLFDDDLSFTQDCESGLRLLATITAQSETIARLTAERDEAIRRQAEIDRIWYETNQQYVKRCDGLTAENARLTAIEAAAREYIAAHDDNAYYQMVNGMIVVVDTRRKLKAALTKVESVK